MDKQPVSGPVVAVAIQLLGDEFHSDTSVVIDAAYLHCAAVCAHDFTDDGQAETVAARR